MLIDLPKTFHTIYLKFLLAKLHTYGFNKDDFEIIQNYLYSRYRTTKTNKSFSYWSEILFWGTIRFCFSTALL